MVAESSEFHLTLSRAHLERIFFQLEIRTKKRDILNQKRESGMTLKKREFMPEGGSVDTYGKSKQKLGLDPKIVQLLHYVINVIMYTFSTSELYTFPH